VDEGWLLRSPFTKAVSRNLIHDAAETPDPIKTRELTDEEALRVMKALDIPERRHTLPVFIAAVDTGGPPLRWYTPLEDLFLIAVSIPRSFTSLLTGATECCEGLRQCWVVLVSAMMPVRRGGGCRSINGSQLDSGADSRVYICTCDHGATDGTANR
jgi:hypothetical protein